MENLTALEYTTEVGWQLYCYADDPRTQAPADTDETDAADESTSAAMLVDLLKKIQMGI